MTAARTTASALAAVLVGIALQPVIPAAAAAATATAMAAAPVVRLMALGDSITYGTGSPGRSGYRIRLQGTLKAAGMRVDFVGSQRTGLCCDRDNEGHGGYSIGQLDEKVTTWLAAARPDIILLHAGTNNVSRGHDPAVIADQLSRLLDKIRTARPDAHVFVSTIVQSNRPAERARNRAFNALVPGVVAAKSGHIYLVDQSMVGGMDLYDAHHPNAYGYSKMSYNFYTAIRRTIPAAKRFPAIANPAYARVAHLCRWNEKTKTRGCGDYRRKTATAKWVRVRR
jgi:lysophospholipase L1-like esterase